MDQLTLRSLLQVAFASLPPHAPVMHREQFLGQLGRVRMHILLCDMMSDD